MHESARENALVQQLRGAQLEMIGDKQWSNPYYWAALVMQRHYK